MANEQKHERSSSNGEGLSLTPQQLQELIATAVKAGREPIVDEAKAEQARRNKARLQAQIQEAADNKKALEEACTHLRDDNTSRIAWIVNRVAAQSRPNAPVFVKEGVCQACNRHIKPSDPDYAQLVRIPVGRMGIVS